MTSPNRMMTAPYTAMHRQVLRELVESRHSVRAFLDTPVDQATLEEIFAIAQHAPSNCNSQPWELYVVSGQARDRMSKLLNESTSIEPEEWDMDYVFDQSVYSERADERRVKAAMGILNSLGIERVDKDGRERNNRRNLDFYDAPHAAFVFMEDWCGIHEAADVGIYAQTLMLTMRAYGIGSCPQVMLSFACNAVRKELGIDDRLKLLFGISFGYPDYEASVNRFRTERAPLSEAVHFTS